MARPLNIARPPDMNGETGESAARLKSDGRKPYLIPGGGRIPPGALGYVNAAIELIAQPMTWVCELITSCTLRGAQARRRE